MNRKDFVNLNRLGKRYHTTHFNIIFRENGLGITRLGITARKNIGNSVKRNGIKRFIREFFRCHKTQFPQGYDIVVIAKKGAGDLDFRSVAEELGQFAQIKKFHVSL